MEYKEIDKRYSQLAESSCCLSCGGAIKHAAIRPGEICVDLGSGRGNDVIRIAENSGESGFAYGIDISEGMIRKSVETAEKLGIMNVKFLNCPLEEILLPDNSADVIISNCTINHSSDKRSVWNEIHRILKKGGRFVVSDIYSDAPVPEEFRNDPAAVAECWAGAVTREEYIDQVKSAGFTTLGIIEESDPYAKGKIMVSSWTISGTKS